MTEQASGHPETIIVEALNRVLASTTFLSAPKARALLAFVVTETMAGRGDLLNERVVARVALGRPVSMDTRTDASTRVQARRVRDLLTRYYASEGRSDELRISIPVGQYAATFVPHGVAQMVPGSTVMQGRHGLPIIAVVQLRHSPAGLPRRLAAGLTESAVFALTRFPGIDVLGPVAPPPVERSDEMDWLAIRTHADYILHGGVVRLDGTVRTSFHLSETTSGRVLWSEIYDRAVADFTGFGAEEEIIRHVVGAVADFSGIVLRETSRPTGTADPEVHRALRRYYAFMDELDPQERPHVIAGLLEALEIQPTNAHLAACAAFSYAVEVLAFGAGAVESLEQADRLGRMALELDPQQPMANNVLGIVSLARGDHAAAMRHAEAAFGLAPMHPECTYLAGAIMCGSGNVERGVALIRDVVAVNPYGPSLRRTWLAIDALLRGDTPTALAEASLLDYPGYVHAHVLRAICYDEIGMDELVDHEMGKVAAIDPEFTSHPGEVLGVVPIVPASVVEHLVARLPRISAPDTSR